jgi:hypothetical protein
MVPMDVLHACQFLDIIHLCLKHDFFSNIWNLPIDLSRNMKQNLVLSPCHKKSVLVRPTILLFFLIIKKMSYCFVDVLRACQFLDIIHLCLKHDFWQVKTFIFSLLTELWCLTSLLTISQLHRGGQFYWWRKTEYSEKTTDLSQITENCIT